MWNTEYMKTRSLKMHFIRYEGPVWKIYCVLRDSNAAFLVLEPLIPVSLRSFSSHQLYQRRIAKTPKRIHSQGCYKNVLALLFMWNSSYPSSL